MNYIASDSGCNPWAAADLGAAAAAGDDAVDNMELAAAGGDGRILD